MIALDPTVAAEVAAVSVGLTQLAKDHLGVSGQWLKLVCVAVGLTSGYVMVDYPALWSALLPALAAATGTGGVSLVGDLAQKFASQPQ